MKEYYTLQEVSNMLDLSFRRMEAMDKKGKLSPIDRSSSGELLYSKDQLIFFEEIEKLFHSTWNEELSERPIKDFKSIELFAGAGGLGLGLEQAGFNTVLLNEIDKFACQTLRKNRPEWNVVEASIVDLSFKEYRDKVDLVTGGFPCQAFSYAGKKLGFEDVRGTMFFEFARCIDEVRPKVFLGENVKGLLNHDKGRTLETIKEVLKNLGYVLIEPKVLKAIYYKVPQKRERLFFIGIRKDLAEYAKMYEFPSPYHRVLTVRDALKKGELYETDVPESEGVEYKERKKEIMAMVPEGGYWKDLPDNIQREYMGNSYFLGGGKTGLARRLSMDAPSLTLVCAPAMPQTERCHPTETRPLTVRESARIQTFPDEWEFSGSKNQAYKQIGNAVPVNLAGAMARSLVKLLNRIEKSEKPKRKAAKKKNQTTTV